jgi:hypothetical protein
VTDREDIIPTKELNTARFWVKRELEGKHLPILPELVEEQLFMQGRTAWNYKYSDLKVDQIKASKKITFNINVSLKKEFHDLIEQHSFSFNHGFSLR